MAGDILYRAEVCRLTGNPAGCTIGEQNMEIKLYHIDSMEYSGSIDVKDGSWEYRGVTNDHMISVTRGMPIKAVLSCLAAFDLVYDVIE